MCFLSIGRLVNEHTYNRPYHYFTIEQLGSLIIEVIHCLKQEIS